MPNVLIFESDRSTADNLIHAFQNAGFSTRWLEYPPSDPAQTVSELRPDVITMDIIMRYMDGLRATQLIKQDPRTKNVPLVIYSNIHSSDNIERGLSLGALRYFVKTNVTPSELVTEIVKLLQYDRS